MYASAPLPPAQVSGGGKRKQAEGERLANHDGFGGPHNKVSYAAMDAAQDSNHQSPSLTL
jgi:hypothetical protein